MAAGDHLAVARRKLFFPYYHHGIDVGDGTAIHLTGLRKRDAKVVQTSLAEFLKNGEGEVIEYACFIDNLLHYKNDMRSPQGREHWMMPSLDEERIEEIRKRIGDPERTVFEARKHLNKGVYNVISEYNLFSNNCEHFAVYCKTGLAISLQSIEHQKVLEQVADVTKSRRPL